MYRDYPVFIESLKRLKYCYPYVKGCVAPLQKLCVNLYFLTERLILLGNPAACCGFEERFFGFQPQNDIGLSWFDFPHHDPEFCRPSIVLGTTLSLSKGRTGHAEPIEASPFRYPAACCGVFMGSTGKGNADGPTSFLAMNYEISKVTAG